MHARLLVTTCVLVASACQLVATLDPSPSDVAPTNDASSSPLPDALAAADSSLAAPSECKAEVARPGHELVWCNDFDDVRPKFGFDADLGDNARLDNARWYSPPSSLLFPFQPKTKAANALGKEFIRSNPNLRAPGMRIDFRFAFTRLADASTVAEDNVPIMGLVIATSGIVGLGVLGGELALGYFPKVGTFKSEEVRARSIKLGTAAISNGFGPIGIVIDSEPPPSKECVVIGGTADAGSDADAGSEVDAGARRLYAGFAGGGVVTECIQFDVAAELMAPTLILGGSVDGEQEVGYELRFDDVVVQQRTSTPGAQQLRAQ